MDTFAGTEPEQTITASDSPSSGPLAFGSNCSETVSFRLNQTTPQQWLTNRMVARTEWWHGVQKSFSTDQNVIVVSPGIQHHSKEYILVLGGIYMYMLFDHSPCEVHSRISECHREYSVTLVPT